MFAHTHTYLLLAVFPVALIFTHTSTNKSLHLDLWHLVVPDECKVSVLRSKIEIKLRKVSNVRWINLACDGTEAAAPAVIMSAPDVNIAEKEKHKHDKWDQLAHQVVEEEAKEELQGDAALNKLFKDIYKNGMGE